MANITIYSTPWCTYCKMAKDFFAQHNISYQEKDVAADEEARDNMVKLSGQLGVPVIEIDNKVIVGFDKDTLSEILGVR